MRWSHSTSNFYALIGQNLTGEFSRKIYGTSAILFPSLQYCWRLGFLKACFFPTLGPLSPSSSPMNSVALASRRCSLWTDVLRRPLCLEGYSTNKAIFFRNQSVNSCIGHFPLESCWWVIWEEEHEKMQCKPSLRWDSHKNYSYVIEGWKWCEPYPPPPPDINCFIFCEHGPMRWHGQTRHFPRTLSPSWCLWWAKSIVLGPEGYSLVQHWMNIQADRYWSRAVDLPWFWFPSSQLIKGESVALRTC